MYLIAGLGNPGRKYDGTKHNMGFDVITELADRYNVPSSGLSMKAMYGKAVIGGEKAILIKPLTYMNLSGEAIQEYVHYYKIDPETQLVVVYDDIDLEPGQLRIRKKGSAGGHNGMKNIIQCLGTDRFARIRVGIGAKPEHWDLADYVLAPFPGDVRETIDASIRDAADAVEMILQGEIDAAMGKYNQSRKKTEQA